MPGKKGNDYFQLLVEMVECSCRAADKLEESLKKFSPDNMRDSMSELHTIEHSGDLLRHSLTQKLAKEFITPIDREDIMALANEIDDVTDTIEDVLLKMYMYNVKVLRPEAVEFAGIVRECCGQLLTVFKEFANYKRSKTITPSIIEINRLEEVGDTLYTNSVRTLFCDNADPIDVLAWNELYRRFEVCCDCCEHAANLVEHIMMKNS